MNLSDVMESLTVDKKVINEYYEREYQHAEFKIKSTDIFTEDVIKYFNDEMHVRHTQAKLWVLIK